MDSKGALLLAKDAGILNTGLAEGAKKISVSQILTELKGIEDIEGITLLGGEPFQQLDASLELIKGCKEMGLSVFLYTGYRTI